jgi:hypothetical protein
VKSKLLLLFLSAVALSLTVVAPQPPQSHPLSEITPVDTDLDMEGYKITNLSELKLANGEGFTGLVLEDYSITHEGDAQRLVLDYQNDEWDVENSDINMNDNSLLNYFDSGCSAGKALASINDSGASKCVSVSGEVSGSYVNITGDIMEGDLNLNGYNVLNPGEVDGVNISNPGNAIAVSGNQYVIPTGAVGTDELGSSAVTSNEIADGTVQNSDLSSDSVTYASGDHLTGGGKVALGGSATLNVDGGSMSWADLGIQQSDVSVSDLGSADSDLNMNDFNISNIGNLFGAGIVNNNNIADRAVGSNEIASGAVGSSELVSDAVTVSSGNQLTGGGSVALGDSITLNLNDGSGSGLDADTLDGTQLSNINWGDTAMAQSDVSPGDVGLSGLSTDSTLSGSSYDGTTGRTWGVNWDDANDLDSDGNVVSDSVSGSEIAENAVGNSEIDNSVNIDLESLDVAGGSVGDGTQSGLTVDSTGNLYFDGSLNFPGDVNTINAQELDGSIVPDRDADQNLGGGSSRWNNLYLASNIYDGSSDNFFENGNLGPGQRVTGIGSDGTISTTTISHDNINGVSSSDHHVRPSAGTLLSEDGSNNFNVQESNINHDNIAGVSYADHHGVGSGIRWDGSNNIALAANDLDNSGNINDFSAADDLNSNGVITDFSNAGDLKSGGDIADGNVENAELANDAVTVAGNSVSLGGSTGIVHSDLSGVSSNDHHSRYSGSEAVTAVEGSTLSHVAFSNNEEGDYTGNGDIFYDQSSGMYVYYGSASNSPDGSTGAGLMWNNKNVKSGNGVSISYDSEDEPTLGVNEGNFDCSAITGGGGLCDGNDATGTDDQTLGEVLDKGSRANQDIDMGGNNLDNTNQVNANDVSASNSFQLPVGSNAY